MRALGRKDTSANDFFVKLVEVTHLSLSVSNYLGRVHPVVHKYTTIFISICRLNTTFFNDIIGDRFRS